MFMTIIYTGFVLLLSIWWYLAIGYVVLALLVYFIQEKFIFKPEKLPADFEYKYDAPFKEINFDIEAGVNIIFMETAAA
jgi:hypothetical protein